jgi:hypothetical protein
MQLDEGKISDTAHVEKRRGVLDGLIHFASLRFTSLYFIQAHHYCRDSRCHLYYCTSYFTLLKRLPL